MPVAKETVLLRESALAKVDVTRTHWPFLLTGLTEWLGYSATQPA